MNDMIQLGREHIIADLQACVTNMPHSGARIRFLAGDAGIGKSTLLEHIALYAAQLNPAPTVAWGYCQSQHGLGEPYLPFKQIIATLLEHFTYADTTHTHNPPQSLTFSSFIHDIAPDVMSLFFAPASILFKTGAFVYRRAQLAKHKSIDTQKFELTKPELFEQCFKILKHVCASRPVVLIFEDLHWADVGTLDLLFYISQRIYQEPSIHLCIIGSYRIVDALTHKSSQSSILSTILEINRYVGNTVIDLTDTVSTAHARAFVDAIIDRTPNMIDTRFREQLTAHTEGHPLFTIELLHLLQMRGKLYLNSNNKLVASTLINFKELPDKVEAIIEARLHRLSQQLTQFVACASVIGQTFRVEWVRHALHKKPHTIAPILHALEHTHRMLKPINAVGTQHIQSMQYKFHHGLFQQYIYTHLSDYQRLHFHLAIASVLEKQIHDLPPEFNAEIAYHYDASGTPHKALPYYIEAAEHALRLFATENSLQWFNRALELLSDTQYQDKIHILSHRRKILRLKGNKDAEWSDLATLEQLSKFIRSDEKLAEVYLWQASYFLDSQQFQRASELCIQAGEIAQAYNNQSLYLQHLVRSAAIFRRQDKLDASGELLAQALHTATQLKDINTQAEVLLNQGLLFFDTGQHGSALTALEKSLSLYIELHNIRAEATCRYIMGLVLVWFGRYQEAEHHAQLALDIFIKIGDRKNEAETRNSLGINYMDIGQFNQAQQHFEQALDIFRSYANQRGEALILFNLGLNYHFQQDIENGLTCLEESLDIAHAISGKRTEATVYTYQGFIYESMHLYQQAIHAYQQGLELRNQLHQYTLSIDCKAGLARSLHHIGHAQPALALVNDIHLFIEQHGIEGIEYPFKVLLTCIQICEANHNHELAKHYVGFAYNTLQERMQHITDMTIHDTYLSAFPEHVAIIKAWKLLHHDTDSG
jgi:predicted ATPase